MRKPEPEPQLQRVTELDVALVAGVSSSTVSRILNGTARVADAKRVAVERAIRELNYRPDQSARSLKMGTTMTVGVLTQHIDSPFFTRMLRGIEEGLAGTGYVHIIVSGNWSPAFEEERVRLLLARRIDGLIVLAGRLPDARLLEFGRHQPVVVIGRELEGRNVHGAWLDQVQAGYLATHHLLADGHRRIADIAGPPQLSDATQRQVGYLKAHEEFGLRPDPALTGQGDFLETGALMAMNRLLDAGQPFTALFAANDQTAYGARMALYRRGIRVPDDISVIGVDDLPAAAYITPAQTTVRQPLYEMGRHAASACCACSGTTSNSQRCRRSNW